MSGSRSILHAHMEKHVRWADAGGGKFPLGGDKKTTQARQGLICQRPLLTWGRHAAHSAGPRPKSWCGPAQEEEEATAVAGQRCLEHVIQGAPHLLNLFFPFSQD